MRPASRTLVGLTITVHAHAHTDALLPLECERRRRWPARHHGKMGDFTSARVRLLVPAVRILSPLPLLDSVPTQWRARHSAESRGYIVPSSHLQFPENGLAVPARRVQPYPELLRNLRGVPSFRH